MNIREMWTKMDAARKRNLASDAHAWGMYCRGRNGKVAALLLLFRFMLHAAIYTYAAAGFVMFAWSGMTLDTFAMPFVFLWETAQPFFGVVLLGALSICGLHVYARAFSRMTRAALEETLRTKGERA